MNFELRKLKATDLFKMVKILNLIGFKNIKDVFNNDEVRDLKSKVNDKNKEKMAGEIGMNIIMSILSVVFENLPSCENELYDFCGGVAGLKSEEVADLEINDFMNLLISIGKKDEFKDFFSQAQKLIK